jgi:hypothetical protein
MQRGRPRKGDPRRRLTVGESRILIRAYGITALRYAGAARESRIKRYNFCRYLHRKAAVPEPATLTPSRLLALLIAETTASCGAGSAGKKAAQPPPSGRSPLATDREGVVKALIDVLDQDPDRVRAIYISIHKLVLHVPVRSDDQRAVVRAINNWAGKRQRRSRAPYRDQFLLPCGSAYGSFHVKAQPFQGHDKLPFLVVEMHGGALESGAVFEMLRLLEPYCSPVDCVAQIDLAIDYVFDKPTAPAMVTHDRKARTYRVYPPELDSRLGRIVNIRHGSRKHWRSAVNYSKTIKIQKDAAKGDHNVPWHLREHHRQNRDIIREELSIRFKPSERNVAGILERIAAAAAPRLLWHLRLMDPIFQAAAAELRVRGSRRLRQDLGSDVMRDVIAAGERAAVASKAYFPQPAEVVDIVRGTLRGILESFARPRRSTWLPVVKLTPIGPAGEVPRYQLRQPATVVPTATPSYPVDHPRGRQVVWRDPESGGTHICDADDFDDSSYRQLQGFLLCGCPLDASACVQAVAER